MDADSKRLASIEEAVSSMAATLGRLERAVQGEIDAGNVGLVRRVAAVEKRQNDDKRDTDAQLVTLKLKMAGYGFLGSSVGGGLLVAILQAADVEI